MASRFETFGFVKLRIPVYMTTILHTTAKTNPKRKINVGRIAYIRFFALHFLSLNTITFKYVIEGIMNITVIPADAPMNPNTTPIFGTRVPNVNVNPIKIKAKMVCLTAENGFPSKKSNLENFGKHTFVVGRKRSP